MILICITVLCCAAGFKWFAAWVYKTCPASMDVFSCKACTSAAYSPTTCCPQQALCDGGESHTPRTYKHM
jgi:hypothetical protein